MSHSLAASIAAAGNSGATLRTGVLSGIDGTTMSVDVGGGTILNMPALARYTPILGDTVIVLQQGPLTLLVDATAGMPDDNAAVDPSFELDPAGATPTWWTVYQDPAGGAPTDAAVTIQAAPGPGAKDGRQVLGVAHGVTAGTGSVYVCSTPVATAPAERWAASAWVLTGAGPTDVQPLVQLSIAWFADVSGVYPADVLSTTDLQAVLGPTGPVWAPLHAATGSGAICPDGAGALQVLLHSQLSGGWVYWDRVVARRLGSATGA